MGCLPSWADELMSGFNANLLNWHTARRAERRRAAAPPGRRERRMRRKRKRCEREGEGVRACAPSAPSVTTLIRAQKQTAVITQSVRQTVDTDVCVCV